MTLLQTHEDLVLFDDAVINALDLDCLGSPATVRRELAREPSVMDRRRGEAGRKDCRVRVERAIEVPKDTVIPKVTLATKSRIGTGKVSENAHIAESLLSEKDGLAGFGDNDTNRSSYSEPAESLMRTAENFSKLVEDWRTISLRWHCSKLDCDDVLSELGPWQMLLLEDSIER